MNVANYFSLCAGWRSVCKRFDAKRVLIGSDLRSALEERPEVFPLQPTLVITSDGNNERVLEAAQWGLLPTDEEDPRTGRHRTLLCRDRIRRVFRDSSIFGPHRCLIPATAFRLTDAFPSRSEGMEVRANGLGLFAVAGVWTRWFAPTGASLLTCGMLTIAIPSALSPPVRWLPMVLSPKGEAAWLQGRWDRSSVDEDSLTLPFGELMLQPMSSPFGLHEVGKRPVPSLLTDLGCVGLASA